jgi:hypothetical protein
VVVQHVEVAARGDERCAAVRGSRAGMRRLFGYRSEDDEPRWLSDRDNAALLNDEKRFAVRVRRGLSADEALLAEGRAIFIDSMWTSDAYALVTTDHLIVGALNVTKPWRLSPVALMRIPRQRIYHVTADEEGIAVLVSLRGFQLSLAPDPSNPEDESEFVLRVARRDGALRSAILGLKDQTDSA